MIVEHTNDTVPHGDLSDCYVVNTIITRVGDKWSVLVVMLLGYGPRRFNELKRMIGGISQRMLTLTLRGLERDGFVSRTAFSTIPPRVDYELTDLGRSLRPSVESLATWAFGHQADIEAARKRFDNASQRTETVLIGKVAVPRPAAPADSPSGSLSASG